MKEDDRIMVDYRSILVERMEYKDSILYLYCRTFYKVVGDGEYNKYDYRLYHRKVLKFKNVWRIYDKLVLSEYPINSLGCFLISERFK